MSFENESNGDANDFYWDFGDGNSSTEAQPIHTYIVAGDYSVTLVSGRKGLSCRDTLIFENYINAFPVGLEDPAAEKSFSIYPSPGREFIYADTEGLEITDAYILDTKGKMLKTNSSFYDDQLGFEIEAFDIGAYFLVLHTVDGIYQQAFVVGP